MYDLRAELAEDYWEVEALFDLCFAPGRTALSSYRLREGVLPVAGLSLVARDPDQILAGAIRFWPVYVGDFPALLLGPIAVHPTRQGEGLGAALIEDALTLARHGHWERVMLVGDAPYYGRFGFQVLQGVQMPPPTNPARVLGQDLGGQGWYGVSGAVKSWNTKA